MSTNKRIRLSAPEAAAYRKESVSTLYRKAQTEPGFPQPHKSDDKHKSNGKQRSFWYKDELDAYAQKQEPRNVLRRQVLDLARRCADRRTGNAGFSHPAVRAYLLAGGDLPTLAGETDYPEDGLRRLCESGGTVELDDDVLLTIYSQAIGQVLRQERTLRERAIAEPKLANDADFRKLLLDLDEAHAICFGCTLHDFLLNGGRANGNA